MHRLRLVLLRVIGPCLALVLLLGGLSEARDQAWADPQVGDKVAVIEHLRLKVPQESREDWMVAERGSWEPWLKHQSGFLGRDLFWDPATEEGTLLIRWSSREAWKSIPPEEVERVQARFEMLACEQTGQNQGNPFPLVFEGELLPQ
uniref:TIGR03792 family protein n=1 Tax=Synechococcus sp. UW106 TaxID=368495 RepID=UPI000E0FE3F6|nr:TIGR03792 family protein [Synechococcus sp. UW106]